MKQCYKVTICHLDGGDTFYGWLFQNKKWDKKIFGAKLKQERCAEAEAKTAIRL